MEIRRGNKSVSKRWGFRRSGGINHKRYDHQVRPTRIDVICPKCKNLAVAIDTVTEQGSLFAYDISESWNGAPFLVSCSKCPYKEKDQTYYQLPDPYHQIFHNGQKLWAWNTDHLLMILKALKGEDISSNRYFVLHTYIHGYWKQHNKEFIQAINKHIFQNNLSQFA